MNMKKLTSILTTAIIGITLMSGCGQSGSDISGTVSMNGSTSMKKLVEASCEVFNAQNPAIKAEGQFTGSGAGLEAVANGTADIGNSSRALKDEEKAKGLVENVVAIDGIAVITDKTNMVKALTTQQLMDIYT